MILTNTLMEINKSTIDIEKRETILNIKNLNVYYSSFHAIKNINLDILKNQITSIITEVLFLKSLHRDCL